MNRELKNLYSWEDILEDGLTDEEYDILDSIETIRSEIRDMFKLINEQIVNGENLTVSYWVPYSEYKKARQGYEDIVCLLYTSPSPRD